MALGKVIAQAEIVESDGQRGPKDSPGLGRTVDAWLPYTRI